MERSVRIRENVKEILLYSAVISLVLFLLLILGKSLKIAFIFTSYFALLQLIVFGYLYFKKKCNICIKDNHIYFNRNNYDLSSLKYICIYTISYPMGLMGSYSSIGEFRRAQFFVKEGGKYISKVFDEKEIGTQNFNDIEEMALEIKNYYRDIDIIINYRCIASSRDKKPSKILAKIRLENMKQSTESYSMDTV